MSTRPIVVWCIVCTFQWQNSILCHLLCRFVATIYNLEMTPCYFCGTHPWPRKKHWTRWYVVCTIGLNHPSLKYLKLLLPFNWWLSWSNQGYYWTIPFVHTSYTDGGGRRSFCINCKLYIHWPRVALNLHYKHVILGPRIVFVGVPGFSY